MSNYQDKDIFGDVDISGMIGDFDNPKDKIMGEQYTYTDFKKLEKTAKSKATKMINALVRSLLTPEMLNSPYIKLKIKLDTEKLRDILYQSETSKWGINSLIQEIDVGSRNARNYEVLATLQKQNGEVIKNLTGLIQVIESEYKEQAANYSPTPKSEPTKLEESSETGALKARGHGGLIEAMKRAKDSMEQDAEYKVITNGELSNEVV